MNGEAIGENLYYGAQFLIAVFVFTLIAFRVTEVWEKFQKGRNHK